MWFGAVATGVVGAGETNAGSVEDSHFVTSDQSPDAMDL